MSDDDNEEAGNCIGIRWPVTTDYALEALDVFHGLVAGEEFSGETAARFYKFQKNLSAGH